MGFLLSVLVNVPEDEWRDILRIARRRGVSRLEGLGDLGGDLEPEEARELASALQAYLEDPAASVRPVPREKVESVVRILGAGEPVHVGHTPEGLPGWMR
jgi:hypothetical protein